MPGSEQFGFRASGLHGGLPQRVEGREEPGLGNGVQWEGKRIYHEIYQREHQGNRFVPVLLSGSDKNHIPWPLADFAHYEIKSFNLQDPGYLQLYRRITWQTENAATANGADRGLITPPLSFRPSTTAESTEGQIVVLDGPKAAAQSDSSLEVLKFRLGPSDDAASGYCSAFSARETEPVQVAFACDPWREKQTREALEKIEDGSCLRDDLAYVGSQLWSGMVHSQVEEPLRSDQVVRPRGVLPCAAPAPSPPRGPAVGSPL